MPLQWFASDFIAQAEEHVHFISLMLFIFKEPCSESADHTSSTFLCYPLLLDFNIMQIWFLICSLYSDDNKLP